MPAYATRADVFLELDPGGFVARARPIEDLPSAVDLTTGTVRLDASAFQSTDRIRFSVTSGGSLPEEYAALGLVYVTPIGLGFDLFQVADPDTGLPIAPLTSEGEGWSVIIDPMPRLDALLMRVSGELDQDLAAQSPPLKPDPITGKYPESVVGIVARTAARRAVTSLMFDNAAFRVATDRLFAQEARDDAQRAAWRNGQPILPRATDQNTIADDASRGLSRAPVWCARRSL